MEGVIWFSLCLPYMSQPEGPPQSASVQIFPLEHVPDRVTESSWSPSVNFEYKSPLMEAWYSPSFMASIVSNQIDPECEAATILINPHNCVNARTEHLPKASSHFVQRWDLYHLSLTIKCKVSCLIGRQLLQSEAKINLFRGREVSFTLNTCFRRQ